MFYITSEKYRLPRFKDKLYAYKLEGTVTVKYGKDEDTLSAKIGGRDLNITNYGDNSGITFSFAELISDNDFKWYLYAKYDYLYKASRTQGLFIDWTGNLDAHLQAVISMHLCRSNVGMWLVDKVPDQIVKYSEAYAYVTLYQFVGDSGKDACIQPRFIFPAPLSEGTNYQIKITLNGKEYMAEKFERRLSHLLCNVLIRNAELNVGVDKKNKLSIFIKNKGDAGEYPDWTPIKVKLKHKTELNYTEEIIFLPKFKADIALKDYPKDSWVTWKCGVRLYKIEGGY